jgi:hypothetical protein
VTLRTGTGFPTATKSKPVCVLVAGPWRNDTATTATTRTIEIDSAIAPPAPNRWPREREPDTCPEATLEALTHFARDPVVRQGLIQSILQQESPLVQAALADVMLKLQEKRSIPSFKKLLLQKDLNGMVRSKIEETITRLT